MKTVLNELQIKRIADTVNESNIASAELKVDLIDHLCCIAEDEMSKGKDFETAYGVAFQRFCPNGLNEIQNETVFLFTSKSRKRLDRTMYVSGFTALTGALITTVMKLLHLPFAQLALLATFFVVVLAFFPAVYIRLFRQKTNGMKSLRLDLIGALLLVVSVVFLINHWPFMQLLLLAAFVCIYIALFPLFFFKIFKKSR